MMLLVSIQSTLAGSATWLSSPPDGDWNNAANWSAGGPPNGASDIATFSISNQNFISLSADTQVSGVTFNSGASNFHITVGPSFELNISGPGIITNNSTQYLMANGDSNTFQFGSILFTNSASAGNFTNFTTAGYAARIVFYDTSTASNATFINNGGDAFTNSYTLFYHNSTAASAILRATGGSSGNKGGEIEFQGDSTGGTSQLELFGNGRLDIGAHNPPGGRDRLYERRRGGFPGR